MGAGASSEGDSRKTILSWNLCWGQWAARPAGGREFQAGRAGKNPALQCLPTRCGAPAEPGGLTLCGAASARMVGGLAAARAVHVVCLQEVYADSWDAWRAAMEAAGGGHLASVDDRCGATTRGPATAAAEPMQAVLFDTEVWRPEPAARRTLCLRGCGQGRLVQLVRLRRWDGGREDDVVNMNGYHGMAWGDVPCILQALDHGNPHGDGGGRWVGGRVGYSGSTAHLPSVQRSAWFTDHVCDGMAGPEGPSGVANERLLLAGDFNADTTSAAHIPLVGGLVLHRAPNMQRTCCRRDDDVAGGGPLSFDGVYATDAYRISESGVLATLSPVGPRFCTHEHAGLGPLSGVRHIRDLRPCALSGGR